MKFPGAGKQQIKNSYEPTREYGTLEIKYSYAQLSNKLHRRHLKMAHVITLSS